MGTMSRSPFGEPLPIFLDPLRSDLDTLDPAVRLEAVSAAIPVYEAMRRLHDRIRRHAGHALITIHGWLREGNYVFMFEIDRTKMAIVGLVIEAPSPDDPDGALSGIMYLYGRPRLFAIRARRGAKSPAARLVERKPFPEAPQARPVHDINAEDAVRAASHRPLRAVAAPATRATLVRGLADVLTMARVALATLARAARSGPAADTVSNPTLPVSPQAVTVALATILSQARRDLLRVRGVLSLATVRAAERICRRTAARRGIGEPLAFTLDGLLDTVAGGPARLGHVMSRKTIGASARDGAQVRSLIERLRIDLEGVLCMSAIGASWSFGTTSSVASDTVVDDLFKAPSGSFAWLGRAPVDTGERKEEPTDLAGSPGEPLVLTVEPPASGIGRPAFFALDDQEDGEGDDVHRIGR